MRALIVGLLWLLPVSLAAQRPQTLVDGDIEHGGFGGPVLAVTQLAAEAAVLMGGMGAWLINDTFYLGGGGMGLATDVPDPSAPAGGPTHRLNFGYGGLVAGYVYGSDQIVHWAAQGMIGAGAVSRRDQGVTDPEPFFVVEPALMAEINVAEFFRVAGGVTYRYVAGVDMPGITATDLSGPSLMVLFKFGSF